MNPGDLKIQARPIRTPVFHHGQDLSEFVIEHAGPFLRPHTVLNITSKLFSVAESCSAPRTTPKRQLIEQEADRVIGETLHQVVLTVKHGVLFPTAGIDESNSEFGDYLLLPPNPFESLKKLHRVLTQKLNIEPFGLIMTDSRTQPLRAGVTGLALAHWGFNPVRDCVGAPDLFGRSLKVTSINSGDPIAAIAVLLMGESDESTPMAIVDAPFLEYRHEGLPSEIQIPIEQDLYGSQLLK